jgi:RNA polymerase sigma-70 factor (ECF subfamily)
MRCAVIAGFEPMTAEARAALQAFLISHFLKLRQKLSARLKSQEEADEVLQEAWIRLESERDITEVRHQEAYLYRVALNIAMSRYRDRSRRLSLSEVDALLQLETDEIDPERILIAKEDLKALEAAVAAMPPRRRAILRAARFEHATTAEIAQRHGVTMRLVQREIVLALKELAEGLKKNAAERGRSLRQRTSIKQQDTDEIGS